MKKIKEVTVKVFIGGVEDASQWFASLTEEQYEALLDNLEVFSEDVSMA